MTRQNRWTIYRVYGNLYKSWDEVYFDVDMTKDQVERALKKDYHFNFVIRKGVN